DLHRRGDRRPVPLHPRPHHPVRRLRHRRAGDRTGGVRPRPGRDRLHRPEPGRLKGLPASRPVLIHSRSYRPPRYVTLRNMLRHAVIGPRPGSTADGPGRRPPTGSAIAELSHPLGKRLDRPRRIRHGGPHEHTRVPPRPGTGPPLLPRGGPPPTGGGGTRNTPLRGPPGPRLRSAWVRHPPLPRPRLGTAPPALPDSPRCPPPRAAAPPPPRRAPARGLPRPPHPLRPHRRGYGDRRPPPRRGHRPRRLVHRAPGLRPHGRRHPRGLAGHPHPAPRPGHRGRRLS